MQGVTKDEHDSGKLIEAIMKDRWSDVRKREVKRYPDQVFVI